MADWIVAESLERLLQQLNALAPNRSKVSDGGIGDARHATRDSDHNPWLVLAGQPLVTARDFTHDPDGGLDCAKLRDSLIRAKDSRIKYLIFNRQIISGADGPQAWRARQYYGTNPHTRHLHISVVADRRCRSTSPWMLPGMTSASPAPSSSVYARLGDRGEHVKRLQEFMTTTFRSYNLYRPTGYYGIATRDGVAEFQRRTGITGSDADGTIVGPRTLRELSKFGFAP